MSVHVPDMDISLAFAHFSLCLFLLKCGIRDMCSGVKAGDFFTVMAALFLFYYFKDATLSLLINVWISV
jgi:hypothetical protein